MPEVAQKTIDVPVGKEEKEQEHAYVMTFIHTGIFRVKGFKHRTIMGYKNVWVMPLFSNLLEEERGTMDESSLSGSDVSPRAHQKEIPISA